MRALKKLGRATGISPGRGSTLRTRALVGDLIANTAFFALAAGGRKPIGRGLALGLLAGLGAVTLPPVLGLGEPPRRGRRGPLGVRAVDAETVGLYVLGGLAAASVAWFARSTREQGVLDDARARAQLVQEHVNTRDSGMIH